MRRAAVLVGLILSAGLGAAGTGGVARAQVASPGASPSPKAAGAAPRTAVVAGPGGPKTKSAALARPKVVRVSRPKHARAPRKAAGTTAHLVRRDLGISFLPPVGYKAVPADRLGAGLAYACTGPTDGGVAATVHLLVQPAPPGEVPPGFAATLAEKLEAAFPPAAELRVVSQGETHVAGVRAAVLSAAISVRGRRLRNCQAAFSRGGRRYLFTFTASEGAFDDRVRAFFGLIESVRWAG